MSGQNFDTRTLAGHAVLNRGYSTLRDIGGDESPWPGTLVRYPDGSVKLHVPSEVVRADSPGDDYGDWWAQPHSYCAQSLYRNSGSIEMVFPKCETNVRSFISAHARADIADSSLSKLTESQLVTLVLSILRTLEYWISRGSTCSGRWWLRHDGCPVFVIKNGQNDLLKDSLEIIESTLLLGSGQWQEFVAEVLTELRENRFESSKVLQWEDYLFARWDSAPILTHSKVANVAESKLNIPTGINKRDHKHSQLYLEDATLNELFSGLIAKFVRSPLSHLRRRSAKSESARATVQPKTSKRSIRRKILLGAGVALSACFALSICLVLLLDEQAQSFIGEIDNLNDSISDQIDPQQQLLSSEPGTNESDADSIWRPIASAYSSCHSTPDVEDCARSWGPNALSTVTDLQLDPELLIFKAEVDDYGGAKLISLQQSSSKEEFLALLVAASSGSDEANNTGWLIRELYRSPVQPAS